MTSVSKPRIGRRGALLIVLGGIFVAVGLSLAINSNDPALAKSYAAPIFVAPLTAWAGVFMCAGVIACAASFGKIGRDAWRFMALCGVAAVWSIAGFITATQFEVPRAFLTALTWGAITSVMLITSGMRGPNDD